MTVITNLIPVEILSIILYKVPFDQLQSLRRVCVLFNKLIKPQITKFKDLIGCNILGVYDNIGDKLLTIDSKYLLSNKRDHTGSLKYDDIFKVHFYLLIKDTIPSLNITVTNQLRIVCFISDKNKCSKSHNNWRIREISNQYLKNLDPGFKYIGEIIKEINTYGKYELLERNNIEHTIIISVNRYLLTLVLDTRKINLGIINDHYHLTYTIWNINII